jgi:hypothetical protein
MPWLKKTRTYRITRISDRSVNKRFALRMFFFVLFVIVLVVNAVPPPMEFEEEDVLYGRKRQTDARSWPEKKLELPEFSKKDDKHRPVPIPKGTLVQETGVAKKEPVVEIQIEYDDVPRHESKDETYELELLPEDERRVAVVQVIKRRRAVIEEKNRERTTTPSAQVVPEPGTGGLILVGLFLAFVSRKR